MRIWRIQTSPRIWKRSINRRRIGSVQPARWKRRTFALLRRKKGKRILRRRTGRRRGSKGKAMRRLRSSRRTSINAIRSSMALIKGFIFTVRVLYRMILSLILLSMSKHQREQCVRSSLDQYFLDLNGSRPHDIYKMIVACVEKPMLEYLLERAQGNQSQAAESLGINRNTLRKKLQLYGLLK